VIRPLRIYATRPKKRRTRRLLTPAQRSVGGGGWSEIGILSQPWVETAFRSDFVQFAHLGQLIEVAEFFAWQE